jgi:trigger factor
MADENEETTTSEQKEESQEAEQPRTAKNTVVVEDVGPCKKKVTVEIPEETIKEAADEQYRELRRDTVLPGFRKGRAPRRLLEKRFGKETGEQIKLKLLAEASEAAIKDRELDILGDPDVDYEHVALPETGPLKFEFEVEIRPQFDLPPLEGIPVTRPKLEVTESQIDREVEQLQRWSGVWTPREGGTVERDDQIIAGVRQNLELTDEEKAKQAAQVEGKTEGEPAPTYLPEAETKLDNAEIYVRPNGFVGSVPVEKLDELLVGAAVGDKKTTTVEIPKTYFREELQGRKVNVEIEIKEIKYLKPAEVNEHFLSRYEVQSIEELREKIRDNLQARLESQVRDNMSEQVYQYLLDNTKFDLPLDIVSRQAGNVLQRQYMNLLSRGLTRQQIEEQMERDGSLAQFRLDVRQGKCISKLLEAANIAEAAPEEKSGKSKKAKKKSTAEPEEGKAE